MTKRAFIIVAAVLISALAVTPASAAWWKTKVTVICAEMHDIALSSPQAPSGAGAFSLTACTWFVNGHFDSMAASVVWLTSPGGDYIYPYVGLTPRDLVINAKMTKAVLTLSDGSVITWLATGNGDEIFSDQSTHFNGVTSRYVIQETGHWATASGTFFGVPFTTEGALGSLASTSIFKRTDLYN